MKTFISYLKKWATDRPDSLAVSDEKSKFSYRELADKVSELQVAYIELGINKGDVIGVAHVSSCLLVANYLALFGLGAHLLPLPDEGEKSDYLKVFEEVIPKYIIYSSNAGIIYEEKQKIHFLCDDVADNYVVEGKEVLQKLECINGNKDLGFKSIPVIIGKASEELYDLEEGKQYLNITSGSTGKIKIANVSTYKIILNAIASNNSFPLKYNDNYCCMFSTGMHPHELFAKPLIAGSGNVLLRLSSIIRFDKYVYEKNITQIVAVPAIYKILLEIGLNKHNWSNVKYILSGGEITNYFVRKEFFAATEKKIIPVWGSTETTGLVFYVPEELLLTEDNYIGVPLPEYSVKVEDETNRLMIKGAACFEGYCNVDNNKYFSKDGYYITDDIVKKDERGIYQYCGRINEIVKINGKKVNLSLLKQALLKEEEVANVEIICNEVDNDKLLGVFCVLKRGKKLNYDSVSRLLSVKAKYHIFILDTFPLLPSKKIDYVKLKSMVQESKEHGKI